MKLYLIQHAEAKSETEDPERSLTVRGEKEALAVSKVAEGLRIRPSRIDHSGKLKAKHLTPFYRWWIPEWHPHELELGVSHHQNSEALVTFR